MPKDTKPGGKAVPAPPVETPALRPYQVDALGSLRGLNGPFRSLVMPTGSGKTRVAMAYAKEKLDAGASVAFICESDAHCLQAAGEAEAVGCPAEWIPGRASETAPPERVARRDALLQDYDAGLHVGLFTYAGYFLGSGVPRAQILIVDDAHAVVAQKHSFSAVELGRQDFNRGFDRVRALLLAMHPLLVQQVEGLTRPVHRGGGAVLLPPPPNAEATEALRDQVAGLTEGSGYAKRLLGDRLRASPNYQLWPCVVTLDSICWRPFILPFESLGAAPGRRMSERELVLITSTRRSEDFLQLRLGLPARVEQATPRNEPPEMGTRLVIPYEELASSNAPSQGHVNVISQWAERFGSVLVTVSSDEASGRLTAAFDGKVQVLRYQTAESLATFRQMAKPRLLVLVNRPSGIDVPAVVCPVAIHLDLPHSTSGHEVVAGDVERSGTVAEASLAVRLSQLLGRLNRGPTDRSAHLLMAGPLPLTRGSVFVKALDPVALLDLLIGQRGLKREHALPNKDELLDEVERFLGGEDAVRERFRPEQERVRRVLTAAAADDFDPGSTPLVEANLFSARTNFTEAARLFGRFGAEAERRGFPAHASFYDFQSACAGLSLEGTATTVLGRSVSAIADAALARNPASPSLVGALRQMRSPVDADVEAIQIELARGALRKQALAFYGRWVDEADAVPEPARRREHAAWQAFWRARVGSREHDPLVKACMEAVQLLGTSTPEPGLANNDARIAYKVGSTERSVALEVKGWDAATGGEDSELTVDDIVQAHTNARTIEADRVLVLTSKRKREREVPMKATQLGVSVMLSEGAVAFADALARQCVSLEEAWTNIRPVSDLPLDATVLETMLVSDGGILESADVRRVLADEDDAPRPVPARPAR